MPPGTSTQEHRPISHPIASAHLQAQPAQQASALQPTDMQTHVLRAEEIAKRLYGIHDSLRSLIGRLYGEGETNSTGGKDGPRAAGLSSELTGALSDIEGVADRIDHAVTRLSSFA